MGRKRKNPASELVDRLVLRPNADILLGEIKDIWLHIVDLLGIDPHDEGFMIASIVPQGFADVHDVYPQCGALNCLEIDVSMASRDGIDLPECGHGGVIKRGTMVTSWHGTTHLDLALQILSQRGIMKNAVDTDRVVKDRNGWYHSESLAQALTYAIPHRVAGIKARIVLRFDVWCALSGNGKAMVTCHDCGRDFLTHIYVISCSCLPGGPRVF